MCFLQKLFLNLTVCRETLPTQFKKHWSKSKQLTIILHKCDINLTYMNHLCCCSEVELVLIEGEVILLSTDAETPHLPFGSLGSTTSIDPSDIPTAN